MANAEETSLAARPIAPPPAKPPASKSKGNGQAKTAIANTAQRRDAKVANVLTRANEIADTLVDKEAESLAQEIGSDLAKSEIAALRGVRDFFKQTTGNSQWLLEGADQVLDGEIID